MYSVTPFCRSSSPHHRTEMQEDLQKLPPGFPRGAVPQPPFPTLAPTMGQMHTLMPTQSLQPTQQLEYKVQSVWLDYVWGLSVDIRKPLEVNLQKPACIGSKYQLYWSFPPIWLPACSDPPGAVLAAATHPAAAQRHGASWSKSVRWRGQHPTTRSAPQKAPGAVAACGQPGEELDFCMCAICISSLHINCKSVDW